MRKTFLLLLLALTALGAALLPGARPAAANPLTGMVDVAAAPGEHTCALTAEGGVKCWGANWAGQVGDGTGGSIGLYWVIRPIPVDVVGLDSGVAAITVGSTHSCALTTAGGVKCWGNNYLGQIGAETRDKCQYYRLLSESEVASEAGWPCAKTPVDVTGLESGVVAIAAGGGPEGFTCAVTDAGGVKCWGDNYLGQLGDGTFLTVGWTPVDVCVRYDQAEQRCLEPLTGAVAISAGSEHACALTGTGEVWCWGYNYGGQVGAPPGDPCFTNFMGWEYRCSPTAVRVCQVWDAEAEECAEPLSDVAALAAGGNHTCALTTAGGVKCWGANYSLQLGTDTEASCPVPRSWSDDFFPCSFTPVEPVGLSGGVTAVAAGEGSHGSAYSCVLMASGGMKCWGSDGHGALGKGRLTPVGSTLIFPPQEVCELYDPVADRCLRPLSDVTAISAGSGHACAVTGAGHVKCWGYNHSGQLGDGCYQNLSLPLRSAHPAPTEVLAAQKVPPGDADRDFTVTSLDALLILQFDAGLIDWLACVSAANANADRDLDAIDAALILQYVAGIIPGLPQ